jgi:hypothetical protein
LTSQPDVLDRGGPSSHLNRVVIHTFAGRREGVRSDSGSFVLYVLPEARTLIRIRVSGPTAGGIAADEEAAMVSGELVGLIRDSAAQADSFGMGGVSKYKLQSLDEEDQGGEQR